jgi:hypothetical protein
MIKSISVFILILSALTTAAQGDIGKYLSTHHYSFTLDKGFDQRTTDTLKQKLSAYKLIVEAEGGSHFLNFYKQLPLVWINFLNANFGLTHFFLESGHTSDVLINKYLQTGDSLYFYLTDNLLWEKLYRYNYNLPKNKKLKYFGIDFERPYAYIKALKSILPATASVPENIKPAIDLIRNASDTLKECDYIININDGLKRSLAKNKLQFVQYFENNYADFEKIVLNNGNCKDRYKDRNKNMAFNFLSFDKDFKQPIYYGELGEAHTVLLNKNVASIINKSLQFKDQVCVVNLYCYNCTTSEEQVSNWPLKKIEKDILKYFLPHCISDFTLFDLSGNDGLIKRYSAYGQFLIIAKNQN